MEIRNIFIGADPELFVEVGGNIVSAHDLIPGTKDMPFPVTCGAIQVDGVAAEFNINPALSAEEFANNIDEVLKSLRAMIREKLGHRDFRLVSQPSVVFDKDYFNGLPDDAKALGCMPDYNAYTGEMNEPPSTDKPMRTGSGHIHIGWGDDFDTSEGSDHFNTCIELTKQLDTVLYLWSLVEDPDRRRRELYGKMGAFRPKPYGVEYRPLSNFWVYENYGFHEDLFEAVLNLVELYFEGKKIYEDPFVERFLTTIREKGDEVPPVIIGGYLDYLYDEYNVGI